MADLASIAAATGAGYIRTQTDRGAGRSPRYVTELGKPVRGASVCAGAEFRAEFGSDTSAAAADTGALAALNGARKLRYGIGAAAGKNYHGDALTFDAD